MVSLTSVPLCHKCVGRCLCWHVGKALWSHLGTHNPDSHLPQGCSIRSWLHFKQQVILLFSSTDREEWERGEVMFFSINHSAKWQSSATIFITEFLHLFFIMLNFKNVFSLLILNNTARCYSLRVYLTFSCTIMPCSFQAPGACELKKKKKPS